MADDSELLQFEADGSGLIDTLDEIDAALQTISDAIQGVVDSASSLDDLQATFDALTSSTDELQTGLDDLSAGLDNAISSLDEVTTSADEASAALDQLTASADEADVATKDAGESGAGQGQAGLMLVGMAAMQAGQSFLSMGIAAQNSFAQVQGMAGVSSQELQQYQGQLDQMATDLGVNMDQLGNGLYYVESAGYSLSNGGLSVLKDSLEAAKAGGTDMQTVASALTSELHAYGQSASQAGYYTDMMIKTVVVGKQNFSDFATGIGALAAAGHNVGMSFSEVTAAEATLTQINPNVRQDMNNLRFLLNATSLSLQGVADSAKKLGLPFDEAKYKSDNLVQRLQYLADISGGTNTTAFKKLTGGAAGLQAALELLSNKGQTFASDWKQIAGATGATNTAFASTENTIQAHMDHIQAQFSVFSTHVVQALTPFVNGVMDVLGKAFDWMSQHTAIVMPILAALAAMLGVVLVAALGALLAPIGAIIATIWPLLLIVGAIAAAAILLAQHWNDVVAALGLQGPIKAVTAAFQQLGNAVSWVQGTVSTAFQKMQQDAETHTLQMKLQTTQTTLDQANQNVANIRQQELGIVHEIETTKDAHTKAMLEMKLQALQQSQEQADGVVKNITKERTGIQQQLAALNPQVQLHNLQIKDSTINSTIEMTGRTIAGYSQMKAGIEQQLADTTNAAKRHALETELAQINTAQQQKEKVLQQYEQQRDGIEKTMNSIHLKIAAQEDNPILKMLAGIRAAASWIAGAFNNVMTVIRPFINDLNNMIKSDFLPIWQQLVSLWQNEIVPQGKQLGQSFQQLWVAIQPLMPALRLLGEFLAGVLVVALGGIIGILSGLMKGIATFLGAIVGAIGGVIQVFSGIIQMVVGMVTLIVDLVTGHFGKLHGDLENIWHGIVTMFSGLWTIAKNLFTAGVGTIIAIVSGFFSGIVGFFTRLKDELVGHSIVPDMINGIIHWFTSLPGKVLAIIGSLVSGVIGHFTQMAQQGLQWISHLITGSNNDMQQMRDQTALHTAEMKQQSLENMMKMQVGAIAQETLMKESLIREIAECKNQHQKHVLEMQLDTINKTIDMREKTVNQAQVMHAQVVDEVDQLKTKVQQDSSDMHDSFLDRMTDLATQAGQKALSIVTGIGSELGKLNNMAIQWGESMLQGFIKGIENQMGNLGNTVSGIWNKISSFFPHSPPKEGPGQDLPNWGPRTIEMFTEGLKGGLPQVELALQAALHPLLGIPQTTLGLSSANTSLGSSQSLTPSTSATSNNSSQLQQLVTTTQQTNQLLSAIEELLSEIARGQGSSTLSATNLHNLMDSLGGLAFESGQRGAAPLW